LKSFGLIDSRLGFLRFFLLGGLTLLDIRF